MSRIALVVGINSYNCLPNLKASSKDAEAIAQCLSQDGDFRVIRLPEIIDNSKSKVGSQASVTRSELRKALVQLFKPNSRQDPDTALFYFSGHGVRDTLGFAEGYLATSDTNPTQDSFGLSLRWLRRLLEESEVKQQIVWLDCCHSGELLNFEEADPGDRGKGRDRCFIAASKDFEAAYEDLSSPHSVLTHALLGGLDPQRHPDRWVDNFLLADFVNQSLKAEIQSPVCNNSGEPINITRSWVTSDNRGSQTHQIEVCPYKGLTFFDCNDEDPKYFYGRTALTDQLLDAVRQSNFLAIVGASGSGKSSVLRAGLLHQLKIGRRISKSDQWDIRLIVPSEHPLQKLALAFIDEDSTQLSRAAQLRQAESLIAEGADGLRRLVQASTVQRVVIVVDQFEECFTLCQDVDERLQFFDCLLGALDLCSERLCIVIAMRADFFGKCVEQEYSGLAKHIEENLVAVKAMSRDELENAIIKPAEKVGLTVEPELVQEILNDLVGAPGSLPLMQYALRELWYQNQKNQLQLKDYSRLGGVMGTLRKRATAVYHSFNKQEQKAAQHIFLSLTHLGEGTEDTRRRVLKQDLITAAYSEQLIDKTVQELSDANLIITSEISSKDIGSQRFAIIDVAHEALIRHWPLLRTWLDANRELIRRQRKIEVLADEWQDQKRKSDYLLRGAQLVDALEFLKKHAENFPLSKGSLTFVEHSLKRRRNIRIRYSSLLLIPLLGFEFLLREAWISNHYSRLRNRNPNDNQRSILALVNGCDAKVFDQQVYDEFYTPFKDYFLERIFGSCRSVHDVHLAKSDLQTINASYSKLSYSNLSFSKLRSAEINNSDLRHSNFIFADLESVNFRESDLSETFFRNANLRNTNLNLTDLSGADFRDSNLDNTSFNKAYIAGSNFRDTNLSQAKISGAIYTLTTQFPEGFDIEEANLYLITSEIDLINADLSLVSLSSANLSKSNIENTDFSKAELFKADFARSLLTKVSFQKSNLSNANFLSSKIIDCNFEKSSLRRANLNNAYLTNSSFEHSNLALANLRNAILKDVNLEGADLSRADLRGADLQEATIEDTVLENAIYNYETKLPAGFSPDKNKMLLIEPGSNLRKARLTSANLISTNLSNVNLKGANLKGVNLRDANLIGADLDNAKLDGAVYNANTSFPADFQPGHHEMYYIAPGSDLSGTEMRDVDLSYENMMDSILTNANLDGASLNNINLRKADLRVASLNRVDLRFANLQGTKLSFASFQDSNLSKADLTGSNLENANFTGANLAEAVLLETTSLTAEMLDSAQLCKTKLPEELELDPNRDCAALGISVLSR